MATTENDILMQQKKNGNLLIIYPITKTKNVIDDNGNGMDDYITKCKTVTLPVANWTQNETTQLYEYNITDSTITANHLIERSYGLN